MYEQIWIIHDGLCSMDLYGTHKTRKLLYLRLTPLCLNTCAGVCISSRSTWGHRNIYGHAGKGTAMVAARESVNEVSSIIPVPESADLFCGYYITCHSRISICGVSKSKGKTDSPLFCKEFWPRACMWCHSTFHPFPHNIPFLIVWREKRRCWRLRDVQIYLCKLHKSKMSPGTLVAFWFFPSSLPFSFFYTLASQMSILHWRMGNKRGSLSFGPMCVVHASLTEGCVVQGAGEGQEEVAQECVVRQSAMARTEPSGSSVP